MKTSMRGPVHLQMRSLHDERFSATNGTNNYVIIIIVITTILIIMSKTMKTRSIMNEYGNYVTDICMRLVQQTGSYFMYFISIYIFIFFNLF